MGAVFVQVPSGLHSSCGARVIGSGIPGSETDNRVGDREQQDVHREGFYLSRVRFFIAGSDDSVLEHGQDGYSAVCVYPMIQYPR